MGLECAVETRAFPGRKGHCDGGPGAVVVAEAATTAREARALPRPLGHGRGGWGETRALPGPAGYANSSLIG